MPECGVVEWLALRYSALGGRQVLFNGTDDSVRDKDSVASAARGLGKDPRPNELDDVLGGRSLSDFELPGGARDRDGGVMEEPVDQLEEQSRGTRTLEIGVELVSKRTYS